MTELPIQAILERSLLHVERRDIPYMIDDLDRDHMELWAGRLDIAGRLAEALREAGM